MINEENLNKLYIGLIDEKELKGYGFNSKDLSALIENGTLERIKRGYYSFRSVDDLFYYGKKLIAEKDYDKATDCFEKCFELDPNHSGVCFQLFLRNVYSKNYEKAFEYFDHFYNSENEFYNADHDFYLYLLSMITELPEKHREYARFLKFEDFRVDFKDKRYENVSLQNKIRLSSLNQRFILASKQLSKSIDEKGKLSVQDIIIKTLLRQAIEVQIRNRNNVLDLLQKQDYEGVIEFLEDIETHHRLSISDNYTLILSKDLVNLKTSQIVPEKKIFTTDNIFEAIEGKNYELALEISICNKKFNASSKNNTIQLLLQAINEEIKELTHKTIEEPVVEIPKKEVETPKPSVVVQEMKESTPIVATSPFADVIKFLINDDLDNSFRALRNYLESINKRQYEFLIINLIKISLLEGDVTFTKPTTVLTYVSRENFEFNISEYIQNFYVALSQNSFDQARVYLDIISKSNNLGQECVLTDGLEQVLNNTEKLMNYRRNSSVLECVEQSIINAENTPLQSVTQQQTKSIPQSPVFYKEESLELEPFDSSETAVQENSPRVAEKDVSSLIIQETNKDYDDNNFINQKLDNLYDKGIVLLKPMDNDRRKGIHEIVNNIPDVVSFSIGADDSRRVVLRYKLQLDGYVDFKQLLVSGSEAYKTGDYDSCIDSYRRVLEVGDPKAFVYARLGLAYMKKLDKDTAIDYLTVATELSKQEENRFDFTELIARLKGLISAKDKKPQIRMDISEFNNDLDEYYGITNIEEIAELVSTGFSIEEACRTVGLDSEQVGIISLIFARECYSQGNYSLGDQYMKKVERMKNKTKFTISLFNEVRKNKRFYKNRVDENHKALIFTPRYKKS